MYAIAEDRSRHITFRPGETLLLDYNEEWGPGTEIVLDNVLAVGGDTPRIGSPHVAGVQVVLEVQGEKKGPKLIVRKYRRRKNCRRRNGFRAKYTVVVVKEIRS